MDPQTIGSGLPVLLLVVPLILAVLDFFAIGKPSAAAVGYQSPRPSYAA